MLKQAVTMRYLFIITIVALIVGCEPVNNETDTDPGTGTGTIDQAVPLFTWTRLPAFDGKRITFVDVNDQDEIIVATRNEWYISEDFGETFTEKSQPDTLHFSNVEVRDGQFFGVGVHDILVEIPVIGGFTRGTSNSLFRSSDGDTWEYVVGPFLMNDLRASSRNFIHVSKYNGVSSIDINTNTEFLNNFLISQSLDFVQELAEDSDGVMYASSHDGVYSSPNSGGSWNKISGDISKDLDSFTSLTITGADVIYASGSSTAYRSFDKGNQWERIRPEFTNEQAQFEDLEHRAIDFRLSDYIYVINDLGFFAGKQNDFNSFVYADRKPFTRETAGTDRYNDVFSFSNGNVLLTRSDGSIFIGVQNPQSNFWR